MLSLVLKCIYLLYSIAYCIGGRRLFVCQKEYQTKYIILNKLEPDKHSGKIQDFLRIRILLVRPFLRPVKSRTASLLLNCTV